jgi:hypothetical protein
MVVGADGIAPGQAVAGINYIIFTFFRLKIDCNK